MNGNKRSQNTDWLSHKERFQNNFSKFSSPAEPSSNLQDGLGDVHGNSHVDSGNSHLEYLFEKAQGVTSASAEDNKTTKTIDYKDGGTCSKYLTDPQAALRNPPQPSFVEKPRNGPLRTPVEEGGSVSGRAIPATPNFLKSIPLSSMSLSDSPRFPRLGNSGISNKTPERELDFDRTKPPGTPQSSRSSVDQGSCRSDSTSSDLSPRRPSFEQTRKHWVYTPRMFKTQEEEEKPQERKKHPGARSRPLPEYLNFRKHSVPTISPRPKVEVKQKAMDDQSPQKEMRSLEKSSADIDNSSVHQLLREGDELSHYDEHSIRYVGRTNPSKVFQLLQSATGSEADYLIEKPPVRRKSRKPESEEPALDADDIVDITYVGGNIPSRTFQCLKEAFDDKDSKDPFSSTELLDPASEPIRSVKVIHLRPRKSIDDGITAL